MQQGQMRTAGWVCIASAVTTLPLTVLGVIAMLSEHSPEARAASVALSFVSLLLFVYIFHSFRRLLTEQFNFTRVNTHISILIALNAVMVAVSVLAAIVPVLNILSTVVAIIALLALGAVYIVLGVKLMELHEQFGGLLKPFCYLTIATGVCFVGVCLLPLGLLTSIVQDVLLALIFFRVAERADVTA